MYLNNRSNLIHYINFVNHVLDPLLFHDSTTMTPTVTMTLSCVSSCSSHKNINGYLNGKDHVNIRSELLRLKVDVLKRNRIS